MSLNQYQVAAARQRLAVERVRNLCLPVPPTQKQADMSRAHIEKRAGNSGTAITRAHMQIELPIEYRTRFTAAVVTGKLDVHEWAARPAQEAGAPCASQSGDDH